MKNSGEFKTGSKAQQIMNVEEKRREEKRRNGELQVSIKY
jgi:hypothetical protein